MSRPGIHLIPLIAAFLSTLPAASANAGGGSFDAAVAFQANCASCHGQRRYGGYAPPLIPETLARKQDGALVSAILGGLPSTQMPPFAGLLDEAQARALVALFRQPVDAVEWSLDDIAASRVIEKAATPAIPASVSRENLILVVGRV